MGRVPNFALKLVVSSNVPRYGRIWCPGFSVNRVAALPAIKPATSRMPQQPSEWHPISLVGQASS
jgi:hypothetical protein